MPGVSDPYRLLGVERTASLAQIKAAHRALAKRYHPDSPTADPQRFLRVQEAYQLLTDPLRRREWDARHAPAPVRADDPPPGAPRPRARRQPRAAREQGPAREPGPEPSARSYTWSAGDVPWWEDGGRRRDAGPTDEPGAAARRSPRSAGQPAGRQADFDVYNRSSGAAWSAASRAYFRRADQDLPRRGSFQYQGSQPLTAARARAAAEAEARRRATADGVADSQRAGAASRPAAPPRRRPMTQPVTPEAGVARDAGAISEVRAKVRAEEQRARWPTRAQRLRYALLGWVPMALLVGYGGPVAAGCQPASCPPEVAPLQALVALALLGMLFALPRAAYATALATTVLAIAFGGLLLGAWLAGVGAPQLATLPAWALLGGLVVLLITYALVTGWLVADGRRQPWAAARTQR